MKILILFFAFALAGSAAGIAGKWNISVPNRDGEARFTLVIRQDGNTYSGAITTEDGDSAPLTDLRLDASQLTFKVITDNAAYDVTATVEDTTIKGTFKVDNQKGGTFTGTRAPTS